MKQVTINITADRGHVADFLRVLSTIIEEENGDVKNCELSFGAATINWPDDDEPDQQELIDT